MGFTFNPGGGSVMLQRRRLLVARFLSGANHLNSDTGKACEKR